MHVLCVNHNEPYQVSHPVGGGDDCTVLSFPVHAVLDVAATLDSHAADHPTAPFRITHAPLTPDLLRRFRTVRRVARRDVAASGEVGNALAVEDEALAVLGAVLRDGYRAHGARPTGRRAVTLRDQRDLVERTKEMLAARPGEAWSLGALAREVHCSPYHLTRVFRQHVGLPAHRYLLRLRLVLALERLESGATNLSALALSLGFSSHSHFTTAFGRAFGVAPRGCSARPWLNTPTLGARKNRSSLLRALFSHSRHGMEQRQEDLPIW